MHAALRRLWLATPLLLGGTWWVLRWLVRRRPRLRCTGTSPHAPPPPPPLALVRSVGVGGDADADFLQVRQYDLGIAALEDRLAGDWCYDKTLLTLTEDATVAEALEALHDARATCALLYDARGGLLGVLDTPDVVRYILRTEADLASSARRVLRQCVLAPADASVGALCKHLGAGMRYIATCARAGGHQILSQRAVAAAVVEASADDASLDAQLQRAVGDAVPSAHRPVLTCPHDATARQAFERMAAYGITSVPLVARGVARGVISATDVLYARDDRSRLGIPALAYVAAAREDAGVARPAHAIVACTPRDTVGTVLRLMMHEAVHHVYVLDPHDAPRGVVSFVDILGALV